MASVMFSRGLFLKLIAFCGQFSLAWGKIISSHREFYLFCGPKSQTQPSRIIIQFNQTISHHVLSLISQIGQNGQAGAGSPNFPGGPGGPVGPSGLNGPSGQGGQLRGSLQGPRGSRGRPTGSKGVKG